MTEIAPGPLKTAITGFMSEFKDFQGDIAKAWR